MSGAACVVYDDGLRAYDFGPGHPLAPVRVDLTWRLAQALGVLDGSAVRVAPATAATGDELESVHSANYVAAVERLSASPAGDDLRHGLGTPDNPVFAGMHDAAAHVVGASLTAARAVWSGEAVHAVNIAGGLHHAHADYASGFCLYNDPAVAIAHLLRSGAERVAYVDIDVHHGDGVQAVFYDDPRVLTISLHESPRTLFPGTGYPHESGGPAAPGTSVNVSLPPGTGDAGWLRAFHAVVPPLLREFRPSVLVSQHGCDSHRDDPLAHLMLTVDGQRAAHCAIHDLAHEVCDGRWVATGGGGYALAEVVPRTWSHLLAVVAGRPLDPLTDVPASWRAHAERATGRRSPALLTDGPLAAYRDWSAGYDPESWLDRSVQRTRLEIFPLHGIDVSVP